MIRHNDATVRTCCLAKFLSQLNKVFHIKGEDDTALCGGKPELFRICGGSIGRF